MRPPISVVVDDPRSAAHGSECVILSSYTGARARLATAVAGAAAFVSRAAAVDDLADVIRRVASGASLLDPDGARRLLRERAGADPRASLSHMNDAGSSWSPWA